MREESHPPASGHGLIEQFRQPRLFPVLSVLAIPLHIVSLPAMMIITMMLVFVALRIIAALVVVSLRMSVGICRNVRPFDDFFQFPSVEPDPTALRTVIDFYSLTFGSFEVQSCAYWAFHIVYSLWSLVNFKVVCVTVYPLPYYQQQFASPDKLGGKNPQSNRDDHYGWTGQDYHGDAADKYRYAEDCHDQPFQLFDRPVIHTFWLQNSGSATIGDVY
jgi:hypothetical protein